LFWISGYSSSCFCSLWFLCKFSFITDDSCAYLHKLSVCEVKLCKFVLFFGYWCYLMIWEWLMFLDLMYLVLLWVINDIIKEKRSSRGRKVELGREGKKGVETSASAKHELSCITCEKCRLDSDKWIIHDYSLDILHLQDCQYIDQYLESWNTKFPLLIWYLKRVGRRGRDWYLWEVRFNRGGIELLNSKGRERVLCVLHFSIKIIILVPEFWSSSYKLFILFCLIVKAWLHLKLTSSSVGTL